MNRIQKWAKVCGFIEQIVQEVTLGDEKLIKEVLDRHKKSQIVTRARKKILKIVRSEIWELHNHNSPYWQIIRNEIPPAGSWKPLGYISISRILGGDHSAWVKMASSLRADANASTTT